MQCEVDREILVPKPFKKYSIDLSIFSSHEAQQDGGLGLGGKEFRKVRKMTYDFPKLSTSARNPLEKDPMFKKLN